MDPKILTIKMSITLYKILQLLSKLYCSFIAAVYDITSARLGCTEMGSPSGRERLTGAENWPVPSADLGATDTR